MQSHICHVRTAYRRLPLGGKLSRKRLMRGDQSALTKGIHSPTCPTQQTSAKPHSATPSHLPINPKTSLYGNRRPKNEKNLFPPTGGCHAGKFREMREVWRGKKSPFKGVLPPPRSSPAPPRSSYPFLRIYLRTRATARRASGIRIAKTMIQTTKTVTETFRRADGRTCDSPIGYCRSSPASHERIAAV